MGIQAIHDFITVELTGQPDLRIEPDEDLFQAGFVNSVGIMRLLTMIEGQWNIKIPMQDLTVENFASLESIQGYIERRSIETSQA